MEIKDHLMQIMKDTSIPRRSGSEGEKTVAGYISSWFFRLVSKNKKPAEAAAEPVAQEAQAESGAPACSESDKICFLNQPFSFSSDTGRVIFGFFALILMFLLFLNFLLLMYFEIPRVRLAMPFLSAAILVYLIFGLGWSPMIERLLKRRTSHMIDTSNLLLKVGSEGSKNIVFTAHYDSKSGLSLLERTALGAMAYFSSALIALYSFVVSIYTISVPAVDSRGELNLIKINFLVQFLIFWVMFIIALMFFMGNRNESPGALDNGSGLAVLLCLSEYFAENPVDGVNLWFVATAAEEEGLVGIVNFLDQNRNALDKEHTCFINLDGTGGGGQLEVVDEYGIPPTTTATSLVKWIAEGAEKEEVKFSSRWAPPAVGFDSVPPAFHGYQAVNLSHTAFDRHLWATHTKEDTPDRINADSMDKTFRVCRSAVLIAAKNL